MSRRLKDPNGNLVDSDGWAEAMANHLETVQWRVRPMGPVAGASLGEELSVNLEPFSEQEVKAAVDRLKPSS